MKKTIGPRKMDRRVRWRQPCQTIAVPHGLKRIHLLLRPRAQARYPGKQYKYKQPLDQQRWVFLKMLILWIYCIK